MSGKPKHWAVMAAAGIGRRMGAEQPKQYLRIRDRAILEHSLLPFCEHPLIEGIAVAIAEEDEYWDTLALSGHARIIRAAGGRERCHSVLNGLARIAEFADDNDWTLVHDAARPCVTMADIDQLVSGAGEHPVGAILAAPVTDTMKKAGPDLEIRETLAREHLWRALTPQMFRLGPLRAALASAIDDNLLVTDEAQAMENSGYRPAIVPGGSHNIKVSRTEDLALAEFYLAGQGRGE